MSKLPITEQGSADDVMFSKEEMGGLYQDFSELIVNAESLLSQCYIVFDFSKERPKNKKSYIGNETLDFKLIKRSSLQEAINTKTTDQTRQFDKYQIFKKEEMKKRPTKEEQRSFQKTEAQLLKGKRDRKIEVEDPSQIAQHLNEEEMEMFLQRLMERDEKERA